MKTVTFSMPIIDGPVIQVTGKGFEHKGIGLVVHRTINSFTLQPALRLGYCVSEPTTGESVCRNQRTQKDAIALAIENIDYYGADRTVQLIASKLAR